MGIQDQLRSAVVELTGRADVEVLMEERYRALYAQSQALREEFERVEAAARQIGADGGSDDPNRRASAAYYEPLLLKEIARLNAEIEAHEASLESLHKLMRALFPANDQATKQQDHKRRGECSPQSGVRHRATSSRRPRERRDRRPRGTRAGPDDDSGPEPAPHHARRRRANWWHSRRTRSR